MKHSQKIHKHLKLFRDFMSEAIELHQNEKELASLVEIAIITNSVKQPTVSIDILNALNNAIENYVTNIHLNHIDMHISERIDMVSYVIKEFICEPGINHLFDINEFHKANILWSNLLKLNVNIKESQQIDSYLKKQLSMKIDSILTEICIFFMAHFIKKNDYENAIIHIRKSFDILTNITDTNKKMLLEARLLLYLAFYDLGMNDLNNTKTHLLKSIQLHNELKLSNINIKHVMIALAEKYKELEDTVSALDWYKNALNYDCINQEEINHYLDGIINQTSIEHITAINYIIREPHPNIKMNMNSRKNLILKFNDPEFIIKKTKHTSSKFNFTEISGKIVINVNAFQINASQLKKEIRLLDAAYKRYLNKKKENFEKKFSEENFSDNSFLSYSSSSA